jgi:hypothetical protein
MIAPGANQCGLPSVIRGGPRGDDRRVVAPGGFSNMLSISDAFNPVAREGMSV